MHPLLEMMDNIIKIILYGSVARNENTHESFLFEVVQKHEYAYELCQLQELIIKKQDERWILYLNDEVMGYVEVKKGFLIKEFCFVWDREKIDQRRDFVKCCNRMDVTPNRSQHQIKNGDILLT